MRILALDVGTSSIKAAVLDAERAQPVGPVARAAYDLDFPTPDAAEVPAERLWSAVAQAAREAARGLEGIEGIGLSVLTPALVLLDGADRPILPIYTHLDRRARPAARQVWAAVGEEFLTTTGNRPLPGGITAVCLRQLLTDDPYLHDRIKCYLHANGWLALRMTGERAFDRANASFTGLYGTLTDQRWSRRWCDYFEVDMAWLPPVVCGSATVGTLRSAVAAELGVPAGLPVKLGTADTSCAMLAAGMGPGDLLHVVGTTQVVAAIVEHPRPDPRRLTRQLGVGDAFIQVTHNPVGGAALGWLRELCFREQTEEEFYEHTIPAALGRSTIVTLDPPFLGGDRLEIEAHRAAFRNLTLATDRLDLLAALLHEMRRQHEKALAALGAGDRFRRVFLTGGGVDVVRRLIPRYANDTVQILEEGSLRGVARLFRPG
ncbi:MAG TPA: FGGY-family carbohydrate kinase [Gemmataceae bacterium]|nr:FGGY-family carbohydrate kinase [Gemmataceae bacterium]